LILSPGPLAVQAISWLLERDQILLSSIKKEPSCPMVRRLWPWCATLHNCQDSAERAYSPMLLINARFRRRPWRLPGQPFRLALKDPLPCAKVEPAVRGGDDHLTPHHLQREADALSRFTAASAACSFVQDRRPRPCGCAPGLWAGLADRHMQRQRFEPHLVIVVKAALVFIEKHPRSSVHYRDEDQRPLRGVPLSSP
jgi:hypothetical protein